MVKLTDKLQREGFHLVEEIPRIKPALSDDGCRPKLLERCFESRTAHG